MRTDNQLNAQIMFKISLIFMISMFIS